MQYIAEGNSRVTAEMLVPYIGRELIIETETPDLLRLDRYALSAFGGRGITLYYIHGILPWQTLFWDESILLEENQKAGIEKRELED